MTERPQVFFTTSIYAHAHVYGLERALETVLKQVAEPPSPVHIAAVRTYHGLAQFADVSHRIDAGGTSLTKVRARHLGSALDSRCSFWVSCDDDVFATPETLAHLVDALTSPEPRIVIVPCAVRSLLALNGGAALVAVELSPIVLERHTLTGARLLLAKRGGFSLVGMNSAAMMSVYLACETFEDDDGAERSLAFREAKIGKKLLGEDFSFFERVPKDVRIEALCTGETTHAGLQLDLSMVGR